MLTFWKICCTNTRSCSIACTRISRNTHHLPSPFSALATYHLPSPMCAGPRAIFYQNRAQPLKGKLRVEPHAVSAAVVRAVTAPVRQAIRVVEDETLRDLEPVPCHKRHSARRVWVRRRLHHVGRARGIDLVPVPALRQAVRRVRACAYIIYNHGSAEELMR